MAWYNVIFGVPVTAQQLVQLLELDPANHSRFAEIENRSNEELETLLHAGNYDVDTINQIHQEDNDDVVFLKLEGLRHDPIYEVAGVKFNVREVWHGSKVQLQDFKHWILGIHCGKTVKTTVPMFDDIDFFNGLSQYKRDRLSPESHVGILQDPAFLAELSPDSKRGVIRMYQQCGFTVHDSEIIGVNFAKKERFTELVTKACSEMPEFFGPIFDGVIPEFYTIPEVCNCYIHQ